jgi:uncharacterized protein (TIGR02271 family)
MSTRKFKAGMNVDCQGTRIGTVRRVQGRGAEQILEVQPAQGGASAQPLQIPAQYVAQVTENVILLNASCEEAARQGWSVLTPTAGSQTAQAGASTATLRDIQPGQSLTVPVVEETLVATTRWQEAGVLEVRKTVRTETQELDVPVRYEEATIERVPVNRVLGQGEAVAPRQEGDTWIVPVVREELVVMKQQILVEELRITKQVQTTTRHIAEPVRREEVELAHPGLDATSMEGTQAQTGA